jgi:hypothetical protein
MLQEQAAVRGEPTDHSENTLAFVASCPPSPTTTMSLRACAATAPN